MSAVIRAEQRLVAAESEEEMAADAVKFAIARAEADLMPWIRRQKRAQLVTLEAWSDLDVARQEEKSRQ